MTFKSLFKREPTTAELEEKLTQELERLRTLTENRSQLALAATFDDSAALQCSKLLDAGRAVSAAVEVLQNAIVQSKLKQQAARDAEEAARLEERRRQALQIREQVAEHAHTFDRFLVAAVDELVQIRELGLQGSDLDQWFVVHVLRRMTAAPLQRVLRHHFGGRIGLHGSNSTDQSLTALLDSEQPVDEGFDEAA